MSKTAPFDRRFVRYQRDRAAQNFGNHNFLVEECAVRLTERIAEMNHKFYRILNLGCHTGELAEKITALMTSNYTILTDISFRMALQAKKRGYKNVVTTEEELLPFAPNIFDAVDGTEILGFEFWIRLLVCHKALRNYSTPGY